MLGRFEQFSQSVSAIHRCIQKIEREEMEKHGLKGAYAQFLVAMSHKKDGVTSAELCKICELNKAAVSRYVSEMEEANLIKKIGESSYRAKLILTEKGKKTADFVMLRARQAVMEIGGELSENERSVFYDVLNRISKKLELLSINGFTE